MRQTTRIFARRILAPMPEIDFDWYLRDWLSATRTSQAELCRRTGWDKRKTSFLVNGQQDYRRQEINEAAAALNVETWELLLHPEDAMAMRQLRDTAISLARDKHESWKGFEGQDNGRDEPGGRRKRA